MADFSHKEQEYLGEYKLLVEEKLNWGNGADWRHHDFEALSGKIFEETGVMLSSTTLKRLWGKLKYESIPNTNTLNALASFVGYENWLAFRTAVSLEKNEGHPQNGARSTLPSNKTSNASTKQKMQSLKWAALLLLVAVVIAFALGFILNKNKKEWSAAELSKVVFTSTPVAQGIPNTVVFKYDVSHLSANKVEIQQSWDKRLRFEVEAERSEATSTYYYPGYFRAKLLVDGQVIKEHDLYIKTEGWLATWNRQPQPRYFLQEELKNEILLGIHDQVMEEVHGPEDPLVLGFHYVNDFDDLYSDNFTLEASFKNTYYKGDGICQLTRIVILCTEGAMIIPFPSQAVWGTFDWLSMMFSTMVRSMTFPLLGVTFPDGKQ